MKTIILFESLAAEVDTSNNNGWTAAHLVVWNDDLASLTLLIKADAGLNMCDMDERRPIHSAIETESVLIMDSLLQYAAHVGSHPTVLQLKSHIYTVYNFIKIYSNHIILTSIES